MFGLRRYPTPIWKPMAPFIAAGGIVFAGIVALQNSALQSEEFKNDPRNPYGAFQAR